MRGSNPRPHACEAPRASRAVRPIVGFREKTRPSAGTRLAESLTRAGWDLAAVRGSHRVWRAPSGRRIVLVERPGEVLSAYVKQVAKALLEQGSCDS